MSLSKTQLFIVVQKLVIALGENSIAWRKNKPTMVALNSVCKVAVNLDF
jgi:hypothetical protein